MGVPFLELEDISLRAGGRLVLDRVGFSWGEASVCALIGPNGAGKTVTMRIAHGLLRPDVGRVLFEGREAPAKDMAFEGQALVFQHPLLVRASVLDNLLLARHAAGVSAKVLRARALEMLERVGLSPLIRAPALALSGGERQRLAIARAWLTGPRLLLLDEPTASLDPGACESIEALIREIAASGCRILMSSHSLGQVARLADEVLFMNAGRLLERSPADAFFRAPKTREAQAFLQGELPWQTETIPAGRTSAPCPAWHRFSSAPR